MATLKQITIRGGRCKTLAVGRVGIGGETRSTSVVEFGYATSRPDPRHHFAVTLDDAETLRLLKIALDRNKVDAGERNAILRAVENVLAPAPIRILNPSANAVR